MNEKIGNVSIEKWKRAFAAAAEIAISKEYFDDILYGDLYPNIHKEIAGIEDEDIQDDIYNEKMDFAEEAFEKIFNVKLYGYWEV